MDSRLDTLAIETKDVMSRVRRDRQLNVFFDRYSDDAR